MLAMLPTSARLLIGCSLGWSEARLLPHPQAEGSTVCCLPAVEDHRNFLQWLSTTVQEAVQTADEHERLKGVIRELKAGIEDRFALAAVQVGCCRVSCCTSLQATPVCCITVIPAITVLAAVHRLATLEVLPLSTWGKGQNRRSYWMCT